MKPFMAIAIAVALAACLTAPLPADQAAPEDETATSADPASSSSDDADGYSWQVDADVAVQNVSGDTDSSKFQEYREVPQGLFLPWLRASGEKKTGEHVELTLEQFTLRDEEDTFTMGKWGAYSGSLFVNKIPDWRSNTSELIFQRSGSTYTLPLAVRQDFESYANAQPVDQSAFQALVDGLLYPYPLRSERSTWGAEYTLDRGPGAQYTLGYSDEHTSGTQGIGTTFFFTNEVELPQPLEYHTKDASLSADYEAGFGPLQLRYDYQSFSNFYRSITWDNPINTVDSVGASAQGQMALPPDSHAQTLSLTGAARMGDRSRFIATFSGSRWEQNESLLPSTVNRALTVAPVPITSPNLTVDTSLMNMVFTSRFSEPLSFTARWRRYDMNDDRPSLQIQQIITDTIVDGDEDPRTRAADFTNDKLSADLDYRASRRLHLSLGVERDRWDRERREVARTTDHVLRLDASYRVRGSLSIRSFFTTGDRDIGPYTPEFGEFDPLRMYFLAARDRTQGGVIMGFTPNERSQVNVAYTSTDDDYRDTTFGLLDASLWSISADGAYATSDSTTAYLGVSYDTSESHMASRYRPVDAEEQPIDNPLNDWYSHQEDRHWTYWVGMNRTFAPSKWDGGFTVSFTDGRANIDAHGVPGGDAAAEAQNWPEIHFKYLALDLFAKHRVTDALSLRFCYRFEDWNEDDFSVDLMEPYMGFIDSESDTSIYLGARVPGYRAHILTLAAQVAF